MKKELMLSYWEGYLSISLFLQKMRVGNKREEDVRLLLSMMNSHKQEQFGNRMNFHKLEHDGNMKTTMLLDWICIIKRHDITKEEVNPEECYQCMIKYIELQEKKFTLRYRQFIDVLERAYDQKAKSEIWKHWIDSCTMIAKP